MLPTLAPGDHLLVDERAYKTRAPAPGDIVVAEHPLLPGQIVVKRIAKLHGEGSVWLQGDNPHEGSDSRQFGPVALIKVRGRVTAAIS